MNGNPWIPGSGRTGRSRPAFLLGPALCLLGLLGAACSSLNKEEQVALDAYKQNAKAYYNSEQYRESITQCLKGLDLDDGDYSLNLTLAWALLLTGTKPNVFEALTQFETTDSMRWFSSDFRVTLGLGQTYYKIATLYRQQLEKIKGKIAGDPEAAELYETEMEKCREGMEENLAECIRYLKKTLEHERQKNNIDALLTLGQAYAYGGDYGEAVNYLTLGLQHLEKSTAFLQKRLDNDPGITSDGRRFFDRQVRRNLAWEKNLRGILAFVYLQDGHLQKALEQYDLLEERGLFREVQHYNRGIVLQALDRYAEAAEEYDKFLRLASISGKDFDEDEHFHLAIEKQEECRKLLEEETMNPGSPSAYSTDGDA